MITFMEESKSKPKESDKCLDSQLWHACAGTLIQMPPVNSKVFYFPQGHSEHSSTTVNFPNYPRIPSSVPCRVSSLDFMANPNTDEVFARIRLVPIPASEADSDRADLVVSENNSNNQEKPTSFAKTLTQSDANNGGGFSVPRYCAETIFPKLDYSADPPVQTLLAKDVQGQTWKFRHIYRGTPRRHLLTTGWSSFVNHKKLIAGDSIVFVKKIEGGDLYVGIRRAKRGIGGGGPPMGWNCNNGGSFSAFLREDERIERGRVKAEDVVEAGKLAAGGQPFEVVYYPRGNSPEFCVRADLVNSAMGIRWCAGMRFKMAFETEDSSRVSWFMGTVLLVQVADPVRWPDSPWRLLEVAWDEPDLLQNVKRVSPWLVELVSSIPNTIHLNPLSPPHKKMRLLPQQSEFPLYGQIPLPVAFSGNPFYSLPYNTTPAGMQGARHAQYDYPSLSNHLRHLSKPHPDFFPAVFRAPNGALNPIITEPAGIINENISCLLTMGNNSTQESKKSDGGKASTPFVLFGKTILTEKQISLSCTSNSSSDGNEGKMGNTSDGSRSTHIQNDQVFQSELGLETGRHCKVFMEKEDVGRSLELSLLGSYEEVYQKLGDLFGIEIQETVNRVVYWDAMGTERHVGEEPFSDFTKKATRLTIVADSGNGSVGV